MSRGRKAKRVRKVTVASQVKVVSPGSREKMVKAKLTVMAKAEETDKGQME